MYLFYFIEDKNLIYYSTKNKQTNKQNLPKPGCKSDPKVRSETEIQKWKRVLRGMLYEGIATSAGS